MNARMRRLAVLALVVAFAVGGGLLARQYLDERAAVTPQAMPDEAPLPKLAMPEAPASAADEADPGFDVVRVEPTGNAVIAGRAAPGAEVELLANGGVIDRTKANEAGEFVIMPPPLVPGSYELTLRTKEGASRQAVTVSVPQPGEGEVLVVVGEPGKPSQVVQAGAPQGPGAGAVPPQTVIAADQAAPLRIAAVEEENGRLFVQGSGPPGARAMIYLNDTPLAEAQIGPDGRWSLTVEQGLTAGNYRVRVDQPGEGGKIVARVEVPFTAEGARPPKSPVVATSVSEEAAAAVQTASATEAAPATEAASATHPPPATEAAGTADITGTADAGSAPAAKPLVTETEAAAPQTTASIQANPVLAHLGTVEVRRGDNLWRISRRIYGAGIRYSTIYEANSDQIRDPNRIYPGQIFVMPAGG